MRRVVALISSLLVGGSAHAVGNIAETVHNLSVTGPGQFKSLNEDRICIFCHTPHSAVPEAPLWNRRSSGSIGDQRRLTGASSAQPGGPSAVCLSCHDGTIALGDMVSNLREAAVRDNDLRGTFLTGRSNLGTDLSNDHPVAIRYESGSIAIGGNLVPPAGVGLPLPDGAVHCTSCHDPHDDSTPPFLHRPSLNGVLCTSCHVLSGVNWNWESSSHAISDVSPRSADPWSERKPEWRGRTVSENACMNCHMPHNAVTGNGLVNDQEEKTCFRCHDSSVAQDNLRAEQMKFFRHPVEQTPSLDHEGGHLENPLSTRLHVECGDCHNPHASRDDLPMISFNPTNPMGTDHSTAPFVNGSLAGVTGIDINGALKNEADYEYEVCFKCHGVPGRSACESRRCSTAEQYRMTRQDGIYNLRDKFDPGNPTLVSYHPVAINDPANNGEVPSLRNDIPLSRGSGLIYCGDCHSSDVSPAAGGIGPRGPHGSRNEAILALRYEFNPKSGFNLASGGLCMKCHDAGSLYGNDSFLHRQHVVDRGLSCLNCHDPHGSASYPHLINFLTSSSASGQTLEITGLGGSSDPTWVDTGRYRGTCYLNCHGTVHDGAEY